MMFCQNCGAQLNEGTKFCPNCGTLVQTAGVPAGAPIQQEMPPAAVEPPVAEPTPAPTPAPAAVMEKETVPPASATPQPAPEPTPYQQPVPLPVAPQQVAPQPAPYQQPVPYVAQPALPMKWYKFVIWVQLFLSALVSVGSALLLLTGAQYGHDSDLAYSMIGGLRVVDIIFAAVFAIYVRQRLAGFKKGAPELYLRFIIIANVISISYNLIVVWLAVSTLTRFLPGANFFDALGMLLESSSTQASLFQLVVSVIAVIVMYFLNRTYFNKRAHLFVNA